MSSEVVEPVDVNLHTTGNGPQKHQEADYIGAISQDSQNASESGSWWYEGKNVGIYARERKRSHTHIYIGIYDGAHWKPYFENFEH